MIQNIYTGHKVQQIEKSNIGCKIRLFSQVKYFFLKFDFVICITFGSHLFCHFVKNLELFYFLHTTSCV
jgi:hypothetical protein